MSRNRSIVSRIYDRQRQRAGERIGHGKSEVIPSLMPRPRKTPEALVTTASVKEKIKDLARRRRQSGGHAFLMPQAEGYMTEDAGGLGYAAPSTGNNNYAQSLPASTGTTNSNKAINQAHKKVPKVTQQSNEREGLEGLREELINTIDDLAPIFEAFVKNPTSVGGNYRKTKVGKSTAGDGVDDSAGILESKVSALNLGAIHGLRGHELPRSHIESKFGPNADHYYSGLEAGKKERAERTKPKKSLLQRLGVTEELKVGEGQDSSPETEDKGQRVKRKYLGAKRGRTATGKPAHAIDVMPVIARPDKNVNKTTPGTPLKRTT
jgi:hypothetical protein